MAVREANKDYYYCSAGKYCIILDTGLKLSGRLSLLTHYKSVNGIGIYIAGLHVVGCLCFLTSQLMVFRNTLCGSSYFCTMHVCTFKYIL